MPTEPSGPPCDIDPDGPGGDGLYGIDCPVEDALLHIIAVPWQATASYRRGTRHGPRAIHQASVQVDLHDHTYGPIWRSGIAWIDGEAAVGVVHDRIEPDALAVIEAGGVGSPELERRAAAVDVVAADVHAWVRKHASHAFEHGRIPAVVGGDHSSPYGLILESARRHPGLGVLQVDAHADLRVAYLGFRHSHASIFYNVLEDCPQVSALVGVGWRDTGASEARYWRARPDRIRPFTENWLAERQVRGDCFADTARDIVAALPPVVHVSIDIDGLDPVLCPRTGTPVPGGLSWRELEHLLRVVSQQCQIVSFDLCEVSPGPVGVTEDDTWDAIVGARLLYKLCGAALSSRLPVEPATATAR